MVSYYTTKLNQDPSYSLAILDRISKPIYELLFNYDEEARKSSVIYLLCIRDLVMRDKQTYAILNETLKIASLKNPSNLELAEVFTAYKN